MIVVIGLILVFWFAYEIRVILSPFLISIVLAYLFNPLVNYFHAQGYKKGVIVAVFSVIFLVIMTVFLSILIPKFIEEIINFKDILPKLSAQIKVLLEKVQVNLEKIYPPFSHKYLPDLFMQKFYALAESLPTYLPEVIGNIFNLLSLIVLIPFITIALLLDSDRLADWLFSIFPSRNTETILSIISEINQVMRDFIRGQVMRLLLLTFLTVIGLFVLKVDFALLFGLLAGIFNLIPVLGAWLGAIVPILVVLVKGDMVLVFKLVVLFIGIQILDNTVISTYYLSKSTDLNLVLVLFAILMGAELYGLMGVILSVPVFSMIKVVIQILYRDYRHKLNQANARQLEP